MQIKPNFTIARAAAAIVFASTASVAVTKQPVISEGVFGVGDLVYRVELKEALPNAFGGADIFGRKRTKGMIEVRYIGTAAPHSAIFRRRDVSVMTNETTLNRSQHFSAYGTQSASGGVVYGSISQGSKAEVLPPDTVEIAVNLDADPTLMIAGTEIRILEATPSKIRVSIHPASR